MAVPSNKNITAIQGQGQGGQSIIEEENNGEVDKKVEISAAATAVLEKKDDEEQAANSRVLRTKTPHPS